MTFRVDVIFNSIRDLQQEKTCLEQQLNEVRNKRRVLETTLDMCKAKANQTHETNQAMQETVKVAQHKVAQMQIHAKSLEDTNQSGREKLKDLNSKIEAEAKRRTDNVQNFESTLEKLSENFTKARDQYKDDNLMKEMVNIHQQKLEGGDTVCQSRGEVEKLQNVLQSLTMNDKTTEEPDVPADMQKIMLEMLLGERSSVIKAREALEADLSRMLEELDEISKALPNYGNEMATSPERREMVTM